MQKEIPAGFRLSPQQKHLWSLQGDGPAAIARVALLLEGKLDANRLKSALQKIVERHEILRTTFQRSAGMKFPFQVINASNALDWQEVDRRPVPTNQEAEQLGVWLKETPAIDLEQSPTLHACLATIADNRHSLVVTLSALCTDDATLTNFVTELCQQYAGSSENGSEPLQYADYSDWQNELLQKNDEEAQRGIAYWKQRDFSSTPSLVLPFERKAESRSSSRSSVVIELGAPLGGTPDDKADFLLACWQVLLGRLSGQPELAVGYISDCRNHEELSSAFGLFAKTLPLIANFAQAHSLADFVRWTGQVRAEISEWQDYFSLEGAGGNLPVSFSVQKRPQQQIADGVSISVYYQQGLTSGFRIQFRVRIEGDSTIPELVYDPAHFHRDVVEQISRRFSILMAAASANPNTLVSKLPIMDRAERHHVLVDFNQTAADYPRDNCIHDLFAEQAKRSPERPALRFGNQVFSYAQLNARANQLAHFLCKRGVKANVPVALCVERSAEMIIGLLGILKAGGCYVPLAPDSPKPRLAHQLSETRAPVILTQESLLDRLPQSKAETVCLDRDHALLAKEPTNNPERISFPGDLVYVIYTSGSTGAPKGVAVQHFSLVNYSHFIGRRLQLDKYPEGLNFATVSTISADLGNTCIFPSLISGGCLHVIGYEMAMAPPLFASYVAQHPIDVLKITPSHLSTLLNAAEGKAILPRKYLVLGGEALSWLLVKRIAEASNCAVINHYGPTEATVGCCTFAVRENDVSAWEPATVPIGRPIANNEIYVLDQHFQPVPVGVAGELCIGGTGVAKGYLNQPHQTEERFIPHPFSKDSSAHLYRTGDLARFLPDGNIEFLGRIDHQVKIRGFRVEPAEIESALKQHPSVKHTVILPYEDKSGEKRLAAYVVSPKNLKTEELRAVLLQQLPEYMVPSAFIILEALPLTPNGKVDLRALPAPEQEQSKAERAFITPRNSAEETLVSIWKEVLKLDRISVQENFFELGGHSLLATQIISRIRNTFRVQLPLHGFLETPTIVGLAEKISQCPPVETEQEEMGRLLQELEGVSDEEAKRLLTAELGENGNTDEGGSSGK